jgi:spermidine synthase
MSADFEEIDYWPTPLGDLVLRRRRDPRIGDTEIFEVKLGEEFLMSSLFHASEQALADLCLAALRNAGRPGPWDVVVGGLGLGYTADAALKHPEVAALDIIELFEGVIDWHRQGLVPLGVSISRDERVRLVQADFFARIKEPLGLDLNLPGRQYDALLVDIDHSPDFPLDQQNSPFYQVEGLATTLAHLKPGGVFGLWSDAPPDAAFEARFAQVFESPAAQTVCFDNPYTGGQSAGTIYFGFNPNEGP